MRIEFNVPVITVGRPARAKSPKTVFASVKRVVDIPEFSERDAPVALTCWFNDEDDDGNEIGFRQYREIDGGLFIDLEPESGGIGITDIGPLRFYNGAGDPPCFPPFHLLARHILERTHAIPAADRRAVMYPADVATYLNRENLIQGPFPDLASLKMEDHDEDMVRECLALFDEAAASLVMVDGILQSKERPPVIQVDFEYPATIKARAVRRPMPGPVIRYDDPDGGQATPLAFFQIDQAEEAVAFVKAFVAGTHSPRAKAVVDLDIEVGDDAPVEFAAKSALVYALAVAVDDNIVEFFGNGHGREEIGLFATVLDQYRVLERELRTGDDENVSDDLVDALEQIISMGPAVRERFVGPDDVVQRLRAALDAWHDRPMDLGAIANRPQV
jgi:hypothetical protein